MADQLLQSVEVETGKRPKLAIIWLHGLGADGHDFEPIAERLALPFPVRFVFPHAPVRPITINMGHPMRAWFDILQLSRDGPEDADTIHRSAASVKLLVDREVGRGLTSQQIVLAGFSQGGALALHAGLRETRPIAGILVLSAFLPLVSSLAVEKSVANQHVPIFMAHGTIDPVIEITFAQQSLQHLRAQGYYPQWHTYPMAHGVCAQELVDIRQWLVDLEGQLAKPATDAMA